MRTEYVSLMVHKFRDSIYDESGKVISDYEDYCNYLYLINAPRQYGLEVDMLQYAKNHPDASIMDLLEFCNTIHTSKALPKAE